MIAVFIMAVAVLVTTALKRNSIEEKRVFYGNSENIGKIITRRERND